ncbi:Dihydroorotate dehydrogenase (quinone), mitochondrial [Galdieria sulphuraria]|nr:Dihydroorotate dehydrogenase (quinone), mitochondrial [Galdieria sulphuraria]
MALRLKFRLIRTFVITTSGLIVYTLADKFYEPVLKPALQLLDPESAHDFAIFAAKHGLVPKDKGKDWSGLACEVWGRQFENPIGLAAGFDKHGDCVDAMLSAGFGFVEVGSVTPEPQEGNPKPRIFRLEKDRAVINRCGFNSVGSSVVSERLRKRLVHIHAAQPGVVGVNLGKNKDTEDAKLDYEKGVVAFADIADYLVINISSPNTPNLRNLQQKNQLADLLEHVIAIRDATLKELSPKGRPPILVKISPDLTDEELADIVTTCMRLSVDGIVISNTTIQRPHGLLEQQVAMQEGGLSGPPLKNISTSIIQKVYRMTNGRLVIVGVGGVSSAEDAYDKIRAGASLIELYTALAYEGPALIRKIKIGLSELLQRDGFQSVQEAIGKDVFVSTSQDGMRN